jgi:4-alpha-glucanotransferase
MKLLFNIEYQTTFGEYLMLNILSKDNASKVTQYKMSALDGTHWSYQLTKTAKPGTYIDYYYSVYRGDDETRHEWLVEPHRVEFAAQKSQKMPICIPLPLPIVSCPVSVNLVCLQNSSEQYG